MFCQKLLFKKPKSKFPIIVTAFLYQYLKKKCICMCTYTYISSYIHMYINLLSLSHSLPLCFTQACMHGAHMCTDTFIKYNAAAKDRAPIFTSFEALSQFYFAPNQHCSFPKSFKKIAPLKKITKECTQGKIIKQTQV